MLDLAIDPGRRPLRLLCLGAHADDIEIGCAGTLLRWLGEHRDLEVTWVVLSAVGARRDEALASAEALLAGTSHRIVLGDFEDSHLPADYARAKTFLRDVRASAGHDIVFTHRLEDAHQDHRLVGELTWQTWRDHLVLEYEIPKYEGDLGHPNLYAPVPSAIAQRKIDHLLTHFASQRPKEWFRAETFSSLMHLRGIECRAEDGCAEGFHLRKARI